MTAARVVAPFCPTWGQARYDELLILDEPTSGLDPLACSQALDLVAARIYERQDH